MYSDAAHDPPITGELLAIATGLAGDAGLDATLHRLCDVAVRFLPNTAFAGITTMRHGRPETAVFTDPASPEIDQAQYASGTGPCLDAFRDGVPYAVVDTENEPRWPAFAAQALAHGIRSTLSIPLTLDEASLGALNLYSKIAGSFSAADREVAEQFATQAAAVLTTAQAYWSAQKLSVQLRQAMDSRETIDQAVGMLMAEHQCGPVEALEMLRQRSQDENRKVRDLAHELVTRFEG